MAAVAALGVAGLVAADRAGGFGVAGADRGGLEGRWVSVESVGVGDGAGPVLDLGGGREVGLLGVESAPGRAAAAADAVRGWIGDGRVRVRFARGGTRDAAGRRVGYVDTEGEVVVNERLLAEGLARTRWMATHPDAGRYTLLARQARDDAERAASQAAVSALPPAGLPADERGGGLESGGGSP